MPQIFLPLTRGNNFIKHFLGITYATIRLFTGYTYNFVIMSKKFYNNVNSSKFCGSPANYSGLMQNDWNGALPVLNGIIIK
jgi:hypothetical protein